MRSLFERPGRPCPADLAERRRGIAAAMSAGLWRTDPPALEVMFGGVRALRYDPPGPVRATVLHLHGGAFRLGAPETVAPFAAALATACEVRVVCPAYRLAPEHPFPAALCDARAVLGALRARGPDLVIVSGDSAGGGLAASLTALCVASGAPVAGLVLLSAWLDLTLTSAGFEANAASDPLFSRAAATEAADLYLQGSSAADPLASPLLGDVTGFPPTLVNVGSGEVLAEDARRFHAALSRAAVDATLVEVPDMEHVAVTRSFELAGAAETFRSLVDFIDRLTGRPSRPDEAGPPA